MSGFKNFLNESKQSDIDKFLKIFKGYEFFKEVKDFKTSATRIQFLVDDEVVKINIQMGTIDVTIDGKKVYSKDFDDLVDETLVDSVVDAIDPKLKDSKLKP